MDDHIPQESLPQIINREKWRDITGRFMDVLQINLFLVDAQGHVILPATRDGFGWSFFEKFSLGWDVQTGNLLDKFQKNGSYWEFRCKSGLQSYGIEIKGEQAKVIAFLVIGPIVLNKKEDGVFYEKLTKQLSWPTRPLMDAVNEVRVVSQLNLKAILDLLAEVARDVTELNLEKRKLHQMRISQEALPKQLSDAAQDIYATIHLDELLVTLLDIALKMTNTECGSIMVLDQNILSVKASRGLEGEKLQSAKARLGEGIAGLSAQENSAFIIHGAQGENRIKHLLKRPEIKHAIVVPISAQNRVFGVLNLHTKKEDIKVEENLDNLQYLSKLIATAFQSI